MQGLTERRGGGLALEGGGNNTRGLGPIQFNQFEGYKIKTRIQFLIAMTLIFAGANVTAADVIKKPQSDDLEKATCSVSCDDGTSCEISSGSNQPKAVRLEQARHEALTTVRTQKARLLLLSPTMAARFAQLERAEARGDQVGISEALISIFSEAELAGAPIQLLEKVSCSCSGVSGRQARCDY